MARVILDVPSDKISPFIQLMLQMGIQDHKISSTAVSDCDTAVRGRRRRTMREHWENFKSSFSGWDRFRNELEFE